MLNAEKKCGRIKSGHIPFSPEAAIWICRTQVYRSLLRYHRGLICNRGNLIRTARRYGILWCFSISIKDILLRIKVCIDNAIVFANMASNTGGSTYINASRMHRTRRTTPRKKRKSLPSSNARKIAAPGNGSTMSWGKHGGDRHGEILLNPPNEDSPIGGKDTPPAKYWPLVY